MSAHSYPMLKRHEAFGTTLGNECKHLLTELRSSVPRSIHDQLQAKLDEALVLLDHILEHGECASDCQYWWQAEQLVSKTRHPSSGGGA